MVVVVGMYILPLLPQQLVPWYKEKRKKTGGKQESLFKQQQGKGRGGGWEGGGLFFGLRHNGCFPAFALSPPHPHPFLVYEIGARELLYARHDGIQLQLAVTASSIVASVLWPL